MLILKKNTEQIVPLDHKGRGLPKVLSVKLHRSSSKLFPSPCGKSCVGLAWGQKYRLAYIVRGECVLRYDNETGKGDHRHFDEKESVYTFTTPEQLVADFQNDIERWNHENYNS